MDRTKVVPLGERVDWFSRHGLAHVYEDELEQFANMVNALGLGFNAEWDNQLEMYYVERMRAVDIQ